MERYYNVAVDTPFNNSILVYKSKKNIEIGKLVWAPLGNRKVGGCVLENNDSISEDIKNKVKEINDVYDFPISIPKEELLFFKWISRYYSYPLGKLIFYILPKYVKSPRKLKKYKKEKFIFNFELNKIQLNYSNKIKNNINSYSKWLLHGVTGSGKTAIYTDVINFVTAHNKSVLFLLPEINLTPQLLDNLSKLCSTHIYLYNSSLSSSDRYGLWNKLLSDDSKKIILGTRSSIFLPIKNLGLIIVDEEHDSSFKQEDHCMYNARDIAIMKASNLNIPIVLGTATPSMETLFNFKEKFINNYLPIKNRVKNISMPKISVVDTKGDYNNDPYWPLVDESINKIKKVLLKRKQILIFINRLGFSNFLFCNNCSYKFLCDNCSVPLKYYKKKNKLLCNYCDYSICVPQACPSCQNININNFGYGTEKLEEVLCKIFPDKVIKRFDRSEITTSKKMMEALDDFHNGKIDIFIGTQMLSKGHDFKNVDLIVILGIDFYFLSSDFRASERAFQLLNQVSGRAGRLYGEGEVVIQTSDINNDIINYVKNHDFDSFYKNELKIRKVCNYPPFSRFSVIYLTSDNAIKVETETKKLVDLVSNWLKDCPSVTLLGYRPNIIEKKVNKYTWNILLRSTSVRQLSKINYIISNDFFPISGLSFKIDVDPYNLY